MGFPIHNLGTGWTGAGFSRSGVPGRIVGLAMVIAVHIAGLLALAQGMDQHGPILVPPVLMVQMISPPRLPAPMPEPPPPNPAKTLPPKAKPLPKPVLLPRKVIPQPAAVVAAAAPPAVVSDVSANSTSTPLAAVPAPPPAPPARVPARLAADGRCALPTYPAQARRNGQSGKVGLRFIIAENGRVEESDIISSSGFPLLDEAAREALSLCHFTPGTVDGQPERSVLTINYVWKLN